MTEALWTLHTIPVYEGMSIAESWEHIVDAGAHVDGLQAVPEFEREDALERPCGWSNVAVIDEQIVGIQAMDDEIGMVWRDEEPEHFEALADEEYDASE